MIEGIKLDFDAEELKAHMEQRSKFHQEKFDWYTKQITSLKDGGVRPSHVSNDPLQNLESSAQDHKRRAQLFSIFATHIVIGEKYRLSDTDLERLELVSRYW